MLERGAPFHLNVERVLCNLEDGGDSVGTVSLRVGQGGASDQREIPGIIEDMKSDGGIYGAKPISYEAETEGRNEDQEGPPDGMASQMD